MRLLTEIAENFYLKWVNICDNVHDAEAMSQINAIVICKDDVGKKRAGELGISFRIEGDSHWKMNEIDHRIFQKYFNRHPEYGVVKHVVNNRSKGYHVETLRHIFDTFKKEQPK